MSQRYKLSNVIVCSFLPAAETSDSPANATKIVSFMVTFYGCLKMKIEFNHLLKRFTSFVFMTIFNEGAYLIFKLIFHMALNLL